jgi:hypothetical protein
MELVLEGTDHYGDERAHLIETITKVRSYNFAADTCNCQMQSMPSRTTILDSLQQSCGPLTVQVCEALALPWSRTQGTQSRAGACGWA